MDRERLDAFRLRFGLEANAVDLKRFRQRVVHAATASLGLMIESERWLLEKEFALRNGSNVTMGHSPGHIEWGIINEFANTKTFGALVENIQHLLWSFETLGYFEDKQRYVERDWVGIIFTNYLKKVLELSPGIDVRLLARSGSWEMVPAGVQILDDSVDRSVSWLGAYPDVQKEFRQALVILAEKKSSQFRQAQDSLRFALEKLLKILLQNSNRLEDQGKPLKEWLSTKGLHEDLRDVAVQIVGMLTKKYQNSAIKHDNSVHAGAEKIWAEFEVEYMIYQYAVLFRLFSEVSSGTA